MNDQLAYIFCTIRLLPLACYIDKLRLQFLIKLSHWSFYFPLSFSYSAQHNTPKGYGVIFMTTCRNSTQIEKHRLRKLAQQMNDFRWWFWPFMAWKIGWATRFNQYNAAIFMTTCRNSYQPKMKSTVCGNLPNKWTTSGHGFDHLWQGKLAGLTEFNQLMLH